ncbi:polyprenyl synthetase family protein [Paenibacillus paeoniae]|nr:polyprenyl synthetase family protein [Paenibacillus paeoniae]
METAAVVEDIILDIQGRTLFHKYNKNDGSELLTVINLPHRMKQFSWGILYLYLRSFKRESITPASIEAAANIELLCLASKIMDDVLDGDNVELEEYIGRSNAIILITDLMFESLKNLHDLSPGEEGYGYLQSALSGEWVDVNRTVLDGMSEKLYYNEILPKTVGVLKYVAAVADVDRKVFWEEFFTHAGIALQIGNDLHAVFDERKSDIARLKPTLPLLKAMDHADESKRAELKALYASFAEGRCSMEEVKKAIIESGALEYCILIREMCKETCTRMLLVHFPEDRVLVHEFLTYLRLAGES